MSFKSKSEKKAFKIGLLAGLKRRKEKKRRPGTFNPYVKQKNKKLEDKRQKFLRLGGARSGVFDISKPEVQKFVREYKEFIPESEIYYLDSKGNLSPVFKK